MKLYQMIANGFSSLSSFPTIQNYGNHILPFIEPLCLYSELTFRAFAILGGYSFFSNLNLYFLNNVTKNCVNKKYLKSALSLCLLSSTYVLSFLFIYTNSLEVMLFPDLREMGYLNTLISVPLAFYGCIAAKKHFNDVKDYLLGTNISSPLILQHELTEEGMRIEYRLRSDDNNSVLRVRDSVRNGIVSMHEMLLSSSGISQYRNSGENFFRDISVNNGILSLIVPRPSLEEAFITRSVVREINERLEDGQLNTLGFQNLGVFQSTQARIPYEPEFTLTGAAA